MGSTLETKLGNLETKLGNPKTNWLKATIAKTVLAAALLFGHTSASAGQISIGGKVYKKLSYKELKQKYDVFKNIPPEIGEKLFRDSYFVFRTVNIGGYNNLIVPLNTNSVNTNDIRTIFTGYPKRESSTPFKGLVFFSEGGKKTDFTTEPPIITTFKLSLEDIRLNSDTIVAALLVTRANGYITDKETNIKKYEKIFAKYRNPALVTIEYDRKSKKIVIRPVIN